MKPEAAIEPGGMVALGVDDDRKHRDRARRTKDAAYGVRAQQLTMVGRTFGRTEELMATSTRPRRRAARERKTERMELRLARSAKQRKILTGADRDAFLDALRNPPEPTEALVAALKRHRELFG